MSKTNLEKLKAQKLKLTLKIQQAENQAKVLERKKELRRKILVGSYYLSQARANNDLAHLKQVMDEYLSRESDRKLFELGAEELEKLNSLGETESSAESQLELQTETAETGS